MAVKNLLLIDDSDIDNMVNRKIVERCHFAENITVKKNARAGLEYLNDTLGSNPALLPELIFLDIRMPDMDGFGFLEIFQFLDPAIRQHCKIAMLSSSIDADDYRRAVENPFVISFVNKPLSVQALQEITR
ncbi:MAG: response regulator [Bacteroidales bacterium]|nr:response regulator [Bacteroidales bacterium]